MEKKTGFIYIVSYIDDRNKKHMTFVKDFSSVRFLEDRFTSVHFEKTTFMTREMLEKRED